MTFPVQHGFFPVQGYLPSYCAFIIWILAANNKIPRRISINLRKLFLVQVSAMQVFQRGYFLKLIDAFLSIFNFSQSAPL